MKPASETVLVPESPSSNSRQKRVMPTRTRRGGPGFGNSDVDALILDTLKRQRENDPLIPADTEFILTTNSALLLAPSSSSNPQTNILANARYFDRPEVLKSYREQAIIQTPEYVSLSDVATVGGRFRPRGVDEEVTDTSDATYEKSHRKFEGFEKRIRLREVEKYKYEHYKLKERMDQLRVLDGAQFMTLDASVFAASTHTAAENADGAHVDDESSPRVNGAGAAYSESDRRRTQILLTAAGLEERYGVLLPPERVRKSTGAAAAAASAAATGSSPPSIEATESPAAELEDQIPDAIEFIHDDDSQHDQDYSPDPNSSKFKIKVPSRPSSAAGTSNSHKAAKKKASLLNGSISGRKAKPSTNSPLARMILPSDNQEQRHTAAILALSPYISQSGVRSHSPGPLIAVLNDEEEQEPQSISAPTVKGRPRKRPRTDAPDGQPKRARGRPKNTAPEPSLPAIEAIVTSPDKPQEEEEAQTQTQSISVPVQLQEFSPVVSEPPPVVVASAPVARIISHPARSSHTPIPSGSTRRAKTPKVLEEPSPGLLLTAALRAANTEKTRKTIRNVTAFGMKLPAHLLLDDPIEFELPLWLLAEKVERDRNGTPIGRNGTPTGRNETPMAVEPSVNIKVDGESVLPFPKDVEEPEVISNPSALSPTAPMWRTIIPSGGDSVDVTMEDATPLGVRKEPDILLSCM